MKLNLDVPYPIHNQSRCDENTKVFSVGNILEFADWCLSLLDGDGCVDWDESSHPHFSWTLPDSKCWYLSPCVVMV